MKIGWTKSTTTAHMNGIGRCCLVGSKLVNDIHKRGLERHLVQERTESKTASIPLSAEQESSLAMLCEMAALQGQSVAKVAVNQDGCMAITTITRSHWLSDGSAHLATPDGTKKTEQD